MSCPITMCILKHHHAVDESSGQSAVSNATECFIASAIVFGAPPTATATVSSALLPAGCTVLLTKNGSQTGYTATFNTQNTRIPCGAGASKFAGSILSNATNITTAILLDIKAAVNQQVLITLTGPSAVWFAVGFNAIQVLRTHPPRYSPFRGAS